jgi:hypothetical protein
MRSGGRSPAVPAMLGLPLWAVVVQPFFEVLWASKLSTASEGPPSLRNTFPNMASSPSLRVVVRSVAPAPRYAICSSAPPSSREQRGFCFANPVPWGAAGAAGVRLEAFESISTFGATFHGHEHRSRDARPTKGLSQNVPFGPNLLCWQTTSSTSTLRFTLHASTIHLHTWTKNVSSASPHAPLSSTPVNRGIKASGALFSTSCREWQVSCDKGVKEGVKEGDEAQGVAGGAGRHDAMRCASCDTRYGRCVQGVRAILGASGGRE